MCEIAASNCVRVSAADSHEGIAIDGPLLA